MIGIILADYEICKLLLIREMVNNCIWWKRFTQCFFCYQQMLFDTPTFITSWVIWHTYNPISSEIKQWFDRFFKMVVMNKSQWFSLSPSFFRGGFRSNRRLSTTTTLAQTFFDHIILQIKRLTSRLMRAVAIRPLLPLLSALIFDNKKAASRIRFYHMPMRKYCQEGYG
jgi:hypothetical protein